MLMTKLGHAALRFETADGTLVVDPGGFTPPVEVNNHPTVVVVTHLHPDHWTPDQLRHIAEQSSELSIVGPAGVVAAAAEAGITVTQVSPGDEITVAGFTLSFHGGQHAIIHSSIPRIDNVGVLINGTVFHPGDSLEVPAIQVPVLAAPAGAPWMKIAEGIDYVLAVAPERCFPIHEGVLSEAGLRLSHDRLRWATEQNGGEYLALAAGDTLQIGG
ncbi:MAG: MBL fold metallo-hydrolase [Mycetocola sp.]